MWQAVYVVMDACAAALLLPRIDALAANAIEPRERARIRSLFNMIIMAVSSPFVYLAGLLSDTDRRLPFMLNAILFLVMVLVVMLGRKEKRSA
jgi:MFS family permease